MFCLKCGASLNGGVCANCNTNNTIANENNYIKSSDIGNLIQSDPDYKKVTETDELFDYTKYIETHPEKVPSNNVATETKPVSSEIKREEKSQPIKETRSVPKMFEEDEHQKKTQNHRRLNYKGIIAIVAGIVICGGAGFYFSKSHNSTKKNTNDNIQNNTSDSEKIEPVSSTEATIVSTDATESTEAIDETTTAEAQPTENVEKTTQSQISTTTYVPATTKPVQYIQTTTVEKVTEAKTTQPETKTEPVQIPITTEAPQEITIPTAPVIDPVTTPDPSYEDDPPAYIENNSQEENTYQYVSNSESNDES